MNFPDDLLSQIFKYFNGYELLILRQVSSQWKRVICLKDRNYYFFQGQTSDNSNLMLKRFGSFFSELQGNAGDLTAWRPVLAQCGRIKLIKINIYQDIDKLQKKLKAINRILVEFPNIKEVELYVDGSCDLTPIFNKNSAVSRLRLDLYLNNSNTNYYMLQSINLQHLTKLDLTCSLNYETIKLISTKFQKLKTLIWYTNISEQNTTQKSSELNPYFLPKLPNLLNFNLYAYSFSRPLSIPHPESLPILKRLKFCGEILKLQKHQQFIWNTVQRLSLNVDTVDWLGVSSHFPKVKVLDLNGISKQLFPSSTKELLDLKYLTSLELHKDSISDLIENKPELSGLKVLRLCFDNYDEEQAELIPILTYTSQKLTNLYELDIQSYNTKKPNLSQLLTHSLFQKELRTLKISINRRDMINLLLYCSRFIKNLHHLNINLNGECPPSRLTKSKFFMPNLMKFYCTHDLKLNDYIHLLSMAPNLTELGQCMDTQQLNYLRSTISQIEGNSRILTSPEYCYYDEWS